ncbi:unnamed protein product [Caenorhabditis auriculariae]|uniref:Uncharacterized protein n=1 Tax=Caenorhabditis auriculariae TaxID=2777116 RepID=A0A8S1HW46_9PELO|nr:unnamed protein product [Caenorhabditis auriculariae]
MPPILEPSISNVGARTDDVAGGSAAHAFRQNFHSTSQILVSMLLIVPLIYLSYRLCKTFFAFLKAIFVYVIAPIFYKPNLDKYTHRWTVVTGGTDGIGKAYTAELAKRGLRKFVLIGRSATKLADCKAHLENTYSCNVKTFLFDFVDGDYKGLRDYICDIDIGFVVHSVGVGRENLERYGDNYEADVQILKVNGFGAAQFLAMVLPAMERRGGGQIVVLSSSQGIRPIPMLAAYSATKSLMSFLCETTDREYKTISVQCLIPCLIATKMTYYKEGGLFVVTPEKFCREAVNSIGLTKKTAGCLNHDLQLLGYEFFPWSVLKYLIMPIYYHQRDRVTKLKTTEKIMSSLETSDNDSEIPQKIAPQLSEMYGSRNEGDKKKGLTVGEMEDKMKGQDKNENSSRNANQHNSAYSKEQMKRQLEMYREMMYPGDDVAKDRIQEAKKQRANDEREDEMEKVEKLNPKTTADEKEDKTTEKKLSEADTHEEVMKKDTGATNAQGSAPEEMHSDVNHENKLGTEKLPSNADEENRSKSGDDDRARKGSRSGAEKVEMQNKNELDKEKMRERLHAVERSAKDGKLSNEPECRPKGQEDNEKIIDNEKSQNSESGKDHDDEHQDEMRDKKRHSREEKKEPKTAGAEDEKLDSSRVKKEPESHDPSRDHAFVDGQEIPGMGTADDKLRMADSCLRNFQDKQQDSEKLNQHGPRQISGH